MKSHYDSPGLPSALKKTNVNVRELDWNSSVRGKVTTADMVLDVVGHEDDQKSVARDEAILATGADFKKLINSGLMTEEGEKQLEEALALEGKGRRRTRLSGQLPAVPRGANSGNPGPSSGIQQSAACTSGVAVTNNHQLFGQGAAGPTRSFQQTTLSMMSSGVSFTAGPAANSPTRTNWSSTGRTRTGALVSTASAPATPTSRTLPSETPTSGNPARSGQISPLREERKRRHSPSPSNDRSEDAAGPVHFNSFSELERDILLSSMRAEEPDHRSAVRDMLRRSLNDARMMGYPVAGSPILRLFQDLFPGDSALQTDGPEEGNEVEDRPAEGNGEDREQEEMYE